MGSVSKPAAVGYWKCSHREAQEEQDRQRKGEAALSCGPSCVAGYRPAYMPTSAEPHFSGWLSLELPPGPVDFKPLLLFFKVLSNLLAFLFFCLSLLSRTKLSY